MTRRGALIAEICRMIDGNILVVETGGRAIDVRPEHGSGTMPELSCPRAPTVARRGQGPIRLGSSGQIRGGL